MGTSSSAERGAVLLSPMVGAKCELAVKAVTCEVSAYSLSRALQSECSGFEAKKTAQHFKMSSNIAPP